MTNSNHAPDDRKAQAQTPAEAAEAQVDLAGSAATDPQPLVDEENDPIADEVKPGDEAGKPDA